MKLSKKTTLQHIEIKAPRWKKRVIGIASFRIGQHNAIEITAKDKKGRRYYPGMFYASGDTIKACETQLLPSGILLYLIPIAKLERLEKK